MSAAPFAPQAAGTSGSRSAGSRSAGRRSAGAPPPTRFAALDLGSNTCRLLIVARAGPEAGGFRVVDSYSEIVRLGEGLAATGALSPAAIERATRALAVCAERIARHPAIRVRCIATEACRTAANAEAFLDRIARDLGLVFEIISPGEEARLAALGCASLIDPAAPAALVVDVGGGSTELVLVDPRAPEAPLAWTSLPLGVVLLAEAGPAAFAEQVAQARAAAEAFAPDPAARAALAHPRAHLIGCSGAATALAGIRLDLPRYDRARIDGLWLTREEVEEASHAVAALGAERLAAHPCVGPARADLVVPGAAILMGVLAAWPAARLRVADRGVREGALIAMMAETPP